MKLVSVIPAGQSTPVFIVLDLYDVMRGQSEKYCSCLVIAVVWFLITNMVAVVRGLVCYVRVLIQQLGLQACSHQILYTKT